jgi:hypothetical protein
MAYLSLRYGAAKCRRLCTAFGRLFEHLRLKKPLLLVIHWVHYKQVLLRIFILNVETFIIANVAQGYQRSVEQQAQVYHKRPKMLKTWAIRV